MPSIFPPTITKANGKAAKDGDLFGSSIIFEGTGFPGKKLSIDVNNGYTPSNQLIGVDPDTGVWTVTLTSLKSGKTKITITETGIASPGVYALNFEVLTTISEDFEKEELQSSRLPIITDTGILFWHNGPGADESQNIIKAKSLRFMSTSFMDEAQFIGKFEGKAYFLSPGRTESSGTVQILLPDSSTGIKKFSKISFWCYSQLGGLTVKCYNGATEVTSSLVLPKGFKQVIFDSPAIDNIRISGYDALAIDKIEITPL